MTRKEKSAKKKTRKESEEENPVMQEADINRLLQNALDQANARHEGLVVFSLSTVTPPFTSL